MTVLLPDGLPGRFRQGQLLIEKGFYQTLKLANLYPDTFTVLIAHSTLNKFSVLSDESLAFVVTVLVFELADHVSTLEALKDHSVPTVSTIER